MGVMHFVDDHVVKVLLGELCEPFGAGEFLDRGDDEFASQFAPLADIPGGRAGGEVVIEQQRQSGFGLRKDVRSMGDNEDPRAASDFAAQLTYIKCRQPGFTHSGCYGYQGASMPCSPEAAQRRQSLHLPGSGRRDFIRVDRFGNKVSLSILGGVGGVLSHQPRRYRRSRVPERFELRRHLSMGLLLAVAGRHKIPLDAALQGRPRQVAATDRDEHPVALVDVPGLGMKRCGCRRQLGGLDQPCVQSRATKLFQRQSAPAEQTAQRAGIRNVEIVADQNSHLGTVSQRVKQTLLDNLKARKLHE